MNGELKALLKNLAETPGVSGQEEFVREVIVQALAATGAGIREDVMGNLLVRIGNSAGRRVGIYAHMDEVGLIVRRIGANGLIYFDIVGNIDERILLGSEVDIVTVSGRVVRGVIGNKSRHLQSADDASKGVSYKKLGIDVGAFSDGEVAAMGIEVGCQVVFSTRCSFFENGTVLGKALDNRVSCMVLIEAIRRLKDKLKNIELIGMFTVQEEVGARGARTAGFGLGLEQSITLDNVPIQNRDDIEYGEPELGHGPVIRLVDWSPNIKFGMISNKRIVERLKKVAKEAGLPHKTDVLTGTYLDSAMAHLTGGGIPSGSICIPRRYAHSAVEMCRLDDMENTIELLCAYLESIDREPMEFGRIYQ